MLDVLGRAWEGPLTSTRSTEGCFYTTVPKLEVDNNFTDLPCNRKGTFRNFFRMTLDEFEEVTILVTPHIKKEDTVYRLSITPRERLMVTLRYLATG